jgi:hypothetical protein
VNKFFFVKLIDKTGTEIANLYQAIKRAEVDADTPEWGLDLAAIGQVTLRVEELPDGIETDRRRTAT